MLLVNLRDMVVTYYVAVFSFFFLKPQANAVVQFNFSTNQLAISEGGDLPSQLFIVKTGQHQGNIIVNVSLNSTVPNDGDYTVNQDQYVFSNETFTLPISIQLVEDRSGEGIESFDLTLALSSQTSTSISADVVFPSQVTVVIIDDDSVVIGFSNDNSSVVITERGPSQTICLEVKEEGLALETFDNVPLNIEIDSGIPGITVELGTNQLVFHGTLMRCTTISVMDNNISEGTRSSYIVISEGMASTVPIEVYPSRIPLIILDNDEIIFIISSNAILVASEGERVISVIKLRKSGNTLLTYNVTLKVQPLTSSASLEDLNIPTVLIFDPSTYEIDIQIEIYVPDDVVFSEERREFSASISVEAINATGTLTSVEGGPIGITVFDNDFEVGFTESRTNITEDLRRNVCVRIFNLGSEDIDPTKLLPLELSISPNNNEGAIELTLDRVILSALSPIVCFDVILSADMAVNDGASFTIQLTMMINQNNIALRQQFIIIDILQLTTAMPSQGQRSLSSAGVAAIMISILLLLSISINVIIIILYYKRIKESDNDGGDNQDAKRNIDGGDNL